MLCGARLRVPCKGRAAYSLALSGLLCLYREWYFGVFMCSVLKRGCERIGVESTALIIGIFKTYSIKFRCKRQHAGDVVVSIGGST